VNGKRKGTFGENEWWWGELILCHWLLVLVQILCSSSLLKNLHAGFVKLTNEQKNFIKTLL